MTFLLGDIVNNTFYYYYSANIITNIITEDLSRINFSINNENVEEENTLELEFDISANDTKDFINNPLLASEIVNIKNSMNIKVHDNINSKFKSVLKRINNYKYIKEKIEEKIIKIEELDKDFKKGILLREKTIKDMNLVTLIDRFLIKKDSGRKFSKISNFYVENFKSISDNNSFKNKKSNIFSLDNLDNFTYLKNSNISNEEVSKHLMIDIDSFIKSKYTPDFVNIVIQNLTNNARSMYTLMPNILSNENVINNKLTTNDATIYISESLNSHVFNFIEIDKEFNFIEYITKSNVFNESSMTKNKLLSNININLSSHYNSPRYEYFELAKIRSLASAATIKKEVDSSFFILNNNADVSSDFFSNFSINEIKFFDNIFTDRVIKDIVLFYAFNQSFESQVNIKSIDRYDIETFNTMLEGNIYNLNFEKNSNGNNNTNNLDLINDILQIDQGDNSPNVYFSNQWTDEQLTQREKANVKNIIERLYYIPISNIYKSKESQLITFDTSENDIGNLKLKKRVDLNIEKFNSYYSFKDLEYTLKIDNFIKSLKRNHLKNLGVNINFFNDIIENIKKSENKIVMQGFVAEDVDNIAILNEKNDAFKLLFNKENNDFYSNVSYTFKNKKIKNNFYPYLKYNFPIDIEEKVTDIFSNYYTKNVFFSSSTYFKKIIENIKSFVQELKSDNYSSNDIITHLLYLSYFSSHDTLSGKNEEVKDIIAKLFTTKAIQKSNQSSSKINNIDLETFSYKIDSFDNIKEELDKEISKLDESSESFESDADKAIKSKIQQIKETFLNSNDNLLKIRQNLFSEERINMISNEFYYSYNFSYLNNKINYNVISASGTQVKRSEFCINWNSIDTVFPFTNLLLKANTDTPINDVKLKKKEKIIKVNSNNNIKEEESHDFYKEKSIKEYYEIVINNKNSDTHLANKKNSYMQIVLKDTFNSITNSKNSGMLINSIVNDIEKLIDFIQPDFKNKTFDLEKDIIDYITGNSKIVDYAKVIIELYSEIFLDIFYKVMFDINIRSYYKLVNPYFQLFDVVNKVKNIPNFGNYFFNLIEEDNKSNLNNNIITLLSKSRNINIDQLRQVYYNTNRGQQSIESLIPSNLNFYHRKFIHSDIGSGEKFDEKFIYAIRYNPYNQTTNDYKFDFYDVNNQIGTPGDQPQIYLDTSILKEIKYEGVESYIYEYLNDLLLDLSPDTLEEDISYNQQENLESSGLSYYTNFNEDIFFKKLEKVKNNLIKSDYYQSLSFDITREVLKSAKNIEEEKDNTRNYFLEKSIQAMNFDKDNFYQNIDNKYFQNIINKNIFNVTKKNNRIKGLLYNNIKNSNDLKETIQGLDIFEFNKDINSYKPSSDITDIVFIFNLPYDNIKILGKNSLLKITLFPKDIHDSDKIYLPISYYLCPNLTSINHDIKNVSSSNILYLENQNIFAEDDVHHKLYDTNSNRISIQNRISEIIDEKSIDKYYNLSYSLDDYKSLILDDIIQNHTDSINFKNMIKLKYDINLNKFDFKDTDILNNFINAMPEYSVINIFKLNKEETLAKSLNNNVFTEESLLNNALNNLMSTERDILEISDYSYYDKYILGIKDNKISYITLSEEVNPDNLVSFNSLTSKQKLALFEAGEVIDINEDSNFEIFTESLIDRKGIIFIIKIETFT